MYKRVLLLSAAFLAACSSSTPQPSSGPETAKPKPSAAALDLVASERIGTRPACLLITDSTGAPLLRKGDGRCAHRYLPFSTFKIPNSLIGLETGHLTGADSVIDWDRDIYPEQDWWPAVWTDRTHDLRSAFRYSHVPFYRTLATKIGEEAIAKYVSDFNYGNKDTSGGLDSFWLNGAIAISADEQISFLRRFYEERLGVSAKSTAVVKDIMIRDRADKVIFSAKTGTGVGDDGSTLAWLVGYVEGNNSVHYFALNVTSSEDDVGPDWRISTVQAVLASQGLWPEF